MARSINTIYNAILTQKAAESDLSGLTSTSQAAVWRLIFYICAVAINLHEQFWDTKEDAIEFNALSSAQGNAQWYASETKKYQHGDTLTFTEKTLTDSSGVARNSWTLDYATIDTTKQIVEYSAATVEDGLVTIKAAKLSGTTAVKLSAAEKTGLEGYWTNKRFAGTPIVVVSDDPDLAYLQYRVTYDPLVLDSTGDSLASPGTYPVHDAIDAFLQGFTDESFGGVMTVLALTSAIEATPGVLNAVATKVDCKPAAGAYTDILAVTDQKYTPAAGYMKIDPTYPLSSNITYV